MEIKLKSYCSLNFHCSKQLLDEGAVLSIYDPKVAFDQILDDLGDSTTDVRLVTCENDEVI
jgi:hypothetical protein